MMGGGAKNALLCQATAGAIGLEVEAFRLEDSAAGNIARQLIALGALKDIAEFRSCLRCDVERTLFTP